MPAMPAMPTAPAPAPPRGPIGRLSSVLETMAKAPGGTIGWRPGLLVVFFLVVFIVVNQGLVTVPFWEYWTSPYSSHYRPYT